MRVCRVTRHKLCRLLWLCRKWDISCINVTCIAVLIILCIATFITSSSRQPTILTAISKHEVNIEKLQHEAIDAFIVEQPDGSAYIAFQIPGSSDVVSAIREGRLNIGNKLLKRAPVGFRHIQETRETDTFDDRFPISVRDNPYHINNERVCKNVNNLQFVVLVHSSTTNFMRRSSIRETWANYKIFKKHSMRIVFLLGKPELDSTQALIEHENSLHSDIIQGRFRDTYRNLTHKGVLGIRWVSEFCTESKTVVKVDDDVFVNVFKLMDDVINTFSKESRTIHCHVREKGTSWIQRQEGKWRIGNLLFKNMTHYPVTHCNGFFTLFTADIAAEMFSRAKSTPFLWLDDVYVYGLLPDKLPNITYTGLPNLNANENYSIECFESRNKTCELLVVYAHTEGVMDKLWYRNLEQYRELAKQYSKDELF